MLAPLPLLASLLAVAAPAGEGPVAAAVPPPAEVPAEPGGSWLAAGAAIAPGLLLHGSGHFVLGDRSSAWRLLAMEGAGLAGLVGGVALLASVGGSEKLAPLYVPIAVGGAGFFAASFLADVAGSARGGRPWALPAAPAGALAVSAGVAGLAASTHELGLMGRWGLDWRTPAYELGTGLSLEGALDYHELAARAGLRLWVRDGDPVTRLWLHADVARQDFEAEGFEIVTARGFGELRWNLGDGISTMENAWLLGRLGWGVDVFRYDGVADDDPLSFLVVDAGLGLSPGDGVELELSYRHRKGELPGGLLASDGLAGFLGFVELQGRVAVAERWSLLPGIRVGNGVLPWLSVESQPF